MKIGELARAASCTTQTIRFYEREGLLPGADRTSGNYRTYTGAHVQRLRFIRNCRRLDMTHDEIRALLSWVDTPAEHCGGVNELLDQHLEHVSTRIRELLQLRRQLKGIRRRCRGEQALQDCGILDGLASLEPGNSHRLTHVG